MGRTLAAPSLTFRGGHWLRDMRALPEEVPVALVYNGTTQAVMMATPTDLEEFAHGFSLTEGFVTGRGEIEALEVVEHGAGIELRMTLADTASARFEARRRATVGPVGCGLCGIDSLAEAMRPLPPVLAGGPVLTPQDVGEAMAGLAKHQPLHDATRAAHAAGFYLPGGGLVMAREDVGRHNALDKLAGAMAGQDVGAGAVVLTCRISLDMVQKCVVLGARIVIAASAPTAEALRQAKATGLTLIGNARDGNFCVFNGAGRIDKRRDADVA